MIPPRFRPGRKVCVLAGNTILTSSITHVETLTDETHLYHISGLFAPLKQTELYLDYKSALTERERRAKAREGSLQP